MRVTFYGGAGGVTGSKHLVEVAGKRILLDCGQFQGHRREARTLNSLLPFDSTTLDAVVLSHGHLDHCGSLPLLVKQGYQGSIYATGATRDVVNWILQDSAHIQEMDAAYMNKHLVEGAEEAKPLYGFEDIPPVMARFVEVPYVRQSHEWFEILPGVRVKLYDAGHILGSAVIVLEAEEEGKIRRIAFTGDLGRANTPLLPDPEFIQEEVELLLSESTYGARIHQPIEKAIEELIQVVRRAVEQKSKIIVPSFALGRTQELVYVLHQLTDEGKIPRLPIYVDSPLAANLTDVFIRHPEDYDEESWKQFGFRGDLPLAFRNLEYVRTQDESKSLNTKPGPFMVISASGMCEAGRIVHHLINNLGDKKNTILITGFQAMNTLGRRLVEGAHSVRIFGQPRRVEAQVVVLNEFSAHADQIELANYAGAIPGLKRVALVHGEATQAEALSHKLKTEHPEWQVIIPQHGESLELD